MLRMMKGFIFLNLILIASLVQARQNLYIHQPYISTRVMGMGGAFAAVADDFNALYYNPAGLALLEEGQLNLAIQAGATPSIMTFSDELKAAGKDSTKLQDVIAKNLGSHYASRVGLGGVWVRPGWGIGFHPVDLTIEADVRSSAGPSIGVQVYQDSTIQFGLAFKLIGPNHEEASKVEEKKEEEPKVVEKAENETDESKKEPEKELTPEELKKQELAKKIDEERKAKEMKARQEAAERAAAEAKDKASRSAFLSLGVAPKVVYRGFAEKDLTLFDLQQSSNLFRPEDLQEGLTMDVDLGLLYRMKVPDEGGFTRIVRPTFAFVVRNLIDAGFKTNFHVYDKNSSINTEKLGRRVDLGTKLDLPSFWLFHPRMAVDFRDLGARFISPKKSFHAGVELLWKAFGWLHGGYRLGISQGYATAGISANLGIFMLDVATYAEEIGSSENPRESRRYMLKASLDF